MPDRISNYRQIRLIINPSRGQNYPSVWSLNAIVVVRGVPTARALASGDLQGLSWDSSEEEIWAALAWVVNRNYSGPGE